MGQDSEGVVASLLGLENDRDAVPSFACSRRHRFVGSSFALRFSSPIMVLPIVFGTFLNASTMPGINEIHPPFRVAPDPPL